ncbi:endonuclease/exonuclease/phosphatase family protein [Scytonema sp. PCC 10023]|uniref:endonuclease/exonuclease/phosphatase family protein n=1 Tax=Scytonema sp. PCC 10023 TaxID=1680591 RepID=UPI0039C64745
MPAINLNSPYSQNFDSLANSGTNSWNDDSTISGWYSNRTSYTAGTGSSNTGSFYSFGTTGSTERALGSVTSGSTNTIYYGARFVNNTSNTITGLNISYIGEQWRNAGNTSPQILDFQYQVGATSLTSGSWIDFNTLDFTSPVTTATAGALDGNATANRTALSSTLGGLNVAPGQEIWLRWQDVDNSGADHGLGIDNFSISTVDAPPPPPPPAVRIHDIQGAAHISPLNGQTVSNVPGIVTATRSNGFYLQDPNPDNDEKTSEGIFVFTSSAPTVAVGDSVTVSGTVSEFRPGGSGGTNNLTTTQISSSSIVTLSSGNALPTATILGNGGRAIPTEVISNDAANGNVENAATLFDPAQDGIDFYESVEGMLVQVNNAVAVGPTSDNGEIPVLADNGANASVRTARGGIVIQPGDFNPERIIIDDAIITSEPQVNVGDSFNGATVGVIDYSFGNFKLLNTQPLPSVTSGGLQREVTNLTPSANQLTVATFNVENLDPGDAATKFNNLASRIVNNLKSPDIINLEEIQDNNGPTNDSVVDASLTFQTLINAIASAGGPTYEFRQINPVDDTNGGEPGGNIRVGFLFNPGRVQFVDRPGGTSTSATTVNNVGGAPEPSFSPGLIDPTNSAFNNSRKPLVGEFIFNGQTVFVVGNHFNSKGGDQPLFGANQPPTLTSETQRNQQATLVKDFVQSILAIDPNANVVVAGDLNDFEFSNPVNNLESAGLTTLIETLPQNERYSYVFDGNSQTLDHILVSSNLLSKLDGFDAVHINSEFAVQDSDHDPVLARFNLINVINGTSSRDTIAGTAFGDRITGFGGQDDITTGGGNDVIVYTTLNGNGNSINEGDNILDFTVGADKFDFSQLLDSIVTGGYNGTNAIADGYISFGARGKDTEILIDSDGSGNLPARPFIRVENVSVAQLNDPNNFVV